MLTEGVLAINFVVDSGHPVITLCSVWSSSLVLTRRLQAGARQVPSRISAYSFTSAGDECYSRPTESVQPVSGITRNPGEAGGRSDDPSRGEDLCLGCLFRSNVFSVLTMRSIAPAISAWTGSEKLSWWF
jgi:hypothetical protein